MITGLKSLDPLLLSTRRGIQALSLSATEGTELTWLKHGCPEQKLFIFLLSSKKFR